MSSKVFTIAIAALLMIVLGVNCRAAWGKEPSGIPDPDYTLWNAAYVDGVALTRDDTGYTVSLRVNGEELAAYTMGSEPINEDWYVLRVPMSIGEQRPGTAKTGDTAYIYINGVLITEAYLEPDHQPVTPPIMIGNPAKVVGMRIHTQIPPGAIDDLAASTGINDGEVALTWTAPGDNGNLGMATGYVVKYSQGPITNQVEFDNATTFAQSWAPSPPGETENHIVTGLPGGETYYFAVEALDSMPLQGSMSNSPVSAMAADRMPPYVIGHNPAPGSTTPTDTNIHVEVKDDGVGVDQNAIQMTVEGALVTPNTASITGGYSLTYDPPGDFAYGQEVNITVYAADLASPPNQMSEPHSYSFKAVENSPPAASDLRITPGEPKTGDNLVASYAYDDEEQHPKSDLTETRWYRDDELQAKYNDSLTLPSSATSKGQQWHFTVRPHDGFGFGALQTSDPVTIGNTRPVADDLSVSPASPLTGDDLIRSYSYGDADDDPESGTELRWYRDDVLQTDYNDTLTVSSSVTAKGQEWYFAVKPKDGTDFGELHTSPTVTIGNTPPVAGDPSISPASPLTGDNLEAVYTYSDADSDPENGTTIRWYKNGSMQSAYNDQKIVPSAATSKEQHWRFVVRPGDGTELGEYQTSSTITIGNTPPVASNVSISPASPLMADDLVVSYSYSDADDDPENGTEVRWYKAGELQTDYSDQKTIPSNITSKGQQWRFTVRPKDGTDFGELQTSLTVTIDNMPPAASDVSISPVSPLTGDDLEAVYTYSDVDGGSESGSEIRWYRDDVLQTDYNDTLTVSSSVTAKGQEWYFAVKPKDGTDFGELHTSPTVTIGNTPPVAGDPSISPASPLTGDNLEAVYTYSDADGDPENGTTIRWYKNDSMQSTYNDQKIVPSAATSKEQHWRFVVRPGDGTELGEYQTSSTITIGNTPPVASNVSISPASPLMADDLVVSYSYSDADDDPENGTEVRWYKAGELQTDYSDQKTIPSNITSKGQQWRFTVRVKDGTDFGALQISPTVTIDNMPPAASDVSISPASPLTGDDLEAVYTYSDVDGGSENGSEIRWYRDGVLQTDCNDTLTVSSSVTAKGQQWYFAVKPKDGTDFGELQTSPIVTIGNTPPAASDPGISPASPLTGDDLEAVYTYSDADGDPENSTTIRWYRNDSIQSAYNDQKIVPSTATSKGQHWRFTVRPGDGTELGRYQTSPTVTIDNIPPVADAGGPYEGKPGEEVTFDGSGSFDPGGDLLTTYSWDFGDDSMGTGVSPSHIYAAAGTYIVTLIVNDGEVDSDISFAVACINEAEPEEREAIIELTVGWNLISSYAQPLDGNLDSALSSIRGKYDSIWAYDAVVGEWLKYTTDGPSSVSSLDEVKPDMGYWVKMNQPATLIIKGVQPVTSVPVKVGWNLVGYNSQTPKRIEECISSIECSSVWTYDSERREWLRYFPDCPSFLNNMEFMQPGKGYWINAKEGGVWNIGQ